MVKKGAESVKVVKRGGGGKKRKIAIEKISNKDTVTVTHTKRCNGLFSKASQLCLLSGAQIAILATPMSPNSHVSFFSFGHSSVDAVVSSFLSGKRPPLPSANNDKHMREDVGVCLTQRALGLGFWWEDETLTRSQNPQELSDAVDSMSKLLEDVKKLRSVDHHHDDVIQNKKVKKSDQEPDQTLSIPHISDGFLQNTDTHTMAYAQDFSITDNKNALPAENLDRTLTTDDYLPNTGSEFTAYPQELRSENNPHDYDQDVEKKDDMKESELVLLGGIQEPDQTLNIPHDCLNINKTKDTEFLVLDDDLPAEDFNDKTEEHGQILAICESFCDSDNKAALPENNNFEGFEDQLGMDVDQLIDFDSSFLDDWVYELQEDGALVLPTSFDQDISFQ